MVPNLSRNLEKYIKERRSKKIASASCSKVTLKRKDRKNTLFLLKPVKLVELFKNMPVAFSFLLFFTVELLGSYLS